MQHKLMVLFTTLVLLTLLVQPASPAQAQAPTQKTFPDCPRYDPNLLREKNVLHSLPPECLKAYLGSARHTDLQPQANATRNATSWIDGFGYTFTAVSYNWITATTNSGLIGDDQFSGPVSIGFSFPFYGTPQSQLYFNTNGLITFGSGSSEWGPSEIPNELNPNHFIATFWDDLIVGAPYNSGAIYYSRGGSAPNRYFVIEWRNVENFMGTGTASFEAILYEKGDIVIQHKSLPSKYFSAVGIEDSSGYQGLEYYYGYSPYGGLPAPGVIRFSYPTTPAARILAYPLQRGGFAPLGGYKDFSIVVRNQGNLGADTFELATVASSWPVTYYASNGVTALSDTDGDSVIDTGPIPQGTSLTIVARYRVPAGTLVGGANNPSIGFTSSLNNTVNTSVALYMSVPAGFANVFMNNSDGAMSFLTSSVDGTKLSKATANGYFGDDLALTLLANGNYLYAWNKFGSSASNSWTNIEYALLSRNGNTILPTTKLTNNSGATVSTRDSSPSIAVAPNGTVGVVWRRYLENNSTGQHNYNIFFATLNAAGTRLTGPTNITNNTVWGTWDDYNIPEFYASTIAATSDNRFIIGWEEDRQVNSSNYTSNIRYTVRNTGGSIVLAPTALTSNGMNWSPILNSLTGGKAIFTWINSGASYYAVINSNGSIFKPVASLNAVDEYSTPDAVQLPNGKVAVAWTTDQGVELDILDSSYNIASGPHTKNTPYLMPGDGISVTTDASNHVIMTWVDTDNYNKQIYALADSTGTFLTDPMFYNTSVDYISSSWNGEGLAAYQASPVISGNAGVAGITLSYTGGSTTSDAGGNYSFKVPAGWSGTATPSRTGYVFSPAKRTYTNVVTDQTAQNYSAIPLYSISGNVGVAGVTLSYLDGTTKTAISQAKGDYSLIVPNNWSGSVTPTHPCFTFEPTSLDFTTLTANQTSQDFTPTLVPAAGCADVDIVTGTTDQARFGLSAGVSTRASFAGVNNGPVKIVSTNAIPLIGAERVIYKAQNVNTSFTEMMALPDKQLDSSYWLPWYNNVDLDTQLRFGNVDPLQTATVHVKVAGVEVTGCIPHDSPFTLQPGESERVSCAGLNNGPVELLSENNVPIVASERLIYKVSGVNTSFSEMMALPNSQLDSSYWLPWYNNVDLDTQLRFGNVDPLLEATVHLFIGGQEMTTQCLPNGPLTLQPGESARVSCTGLNAGPVQIRSDNNVPIVVAERVIYKAAGGTKTSFSEMMALPNKQVGSSYWLPWYNNADLDTQLRIGNVDPLLEATVHLFIGGQEMTTQCLPNGPLTLQPGESARVSCAGLNNGPVQIQSDNNVPIVAAERLIYKVDKVNTSFSEMMALSDSQLDDTYWLPWYNNVDLDTQLRFGVP